MGPGVGTFLVFAPPPSFKRMQICETLKTEGFVSKYANFKHSIVKKLETEKEGGQKLEKCHRFSDHALVLRSIESFLQKVIVTNNF